MKTSDGMIEAYTVSVGGHLGKGATFNTPLKGRVPADRVAPVLKELILFYKEHREPEEPFWRFVRRVGIRRPAEALRRNPEPDCGVLRGGADEPGRDLSL